MPTTTSRVRWSRWAVLLASAALSACALSRQAEPEEGSMLTGSVTYRPRIALPPDAVVHVSVLDVSRADAPATTIAEQTIATARRQVPIPFAMAVDRAGIDPRSRLVARAEIRGSDGQLLWTTDTAYPLPVAGPLPDDLTLVVVQVDRSPGAPAALVGPTWQLVRITTADGRELTPGREESYTIAFDSTGRFSGRAHCNQYGGDYSASAAGRLELDQVISTLAACAPPSVAEEFMRVINGAGEFSLADGQLRLSAAGGGSLLFQRAGGD